MTAIRQTGADGFAAAVVAWGAASGRDLPWRATRDPWAVLVSEVMLQQTQVARVLGPWERFLSRFPDPSTCAAAPVGEVIAAWHGLGYNRRAVALHRAATACRDRHGGRVPSDVESLLALPGVGAYTARAVLAFAFEADVGVVDTNAARVLARAVAGRRLDRAEVQALADRLVPAGQGWAYNQAVLDLGATVCTRRRPACRRCPVAGQCAWAGVGPPRPDPAFDPSWAGSGPSWPDPAFDPPRPAPSRPDPAFDPSWAGAGRSRPDPAAGTAGTSGRQSSFRGSDRQGRGRLVAALRAGPLPAGELAATAGWPGDQVRVERVVASLIADGLVAVDADGTVHLPG